MTTYNTLTAQMRQAKTLEEFHIYAVALVQHLKQTREAKNEISLPPSRPQQAGHGHHAPGLTPLFTKGHT